MQNNDFVRIAYEGRIKETNQMFDKTENSPVIIGSGYALTGLEDALKEMDVNEKRVIEIPPEKGFGIRNPNLIKLITISEFRKHDTKPFPGMFVDADNIRGRVLSVSSGRVRVDFNHPLAGKTLIYNLEIKEKIEKPEDKIKAVIEIYTKINNVNITINNKEADIIVPPLINPVFKKKIADDIMRFLNIERVKFSEVFEKMKEN